MSYVYTILTSHGRYSPCHDSMSHVYTILTSHGRSSPCNDSMSHVYTLLTSQGRSCTCNDSMSHENTILTSWKSSLSGWAHSSASVVSSSLGQVVRPCPLPASKMSFMGKTSLLLPSPLPRSCNICEQLSRGGTWPLLSRSSVSASGFWKNSKHFCQRLEDIVLSL